MSSLITSSIWLSLLSLTRCRLTTRLLTRFQPSATSLEADAKGCRLTSIFPPVAPPGNDAEGRLYPLPPDAPGHGPAMVGPLTWPPTPAHGITPGTQHDQGQATQREMRLGRMAQGVAGPGRKRPAERPVRGRVRQDRAGNAARPTVTPSDNVPMETALPGRASGLPPSLANRSARSLRPNYRWHSSYAADVRKRPEAKPVPAAG